MSDAVIIERCGPIGWIRLNRPERRNAVSYASLEQLLWACQQVADDETIRAVVLTGAGTAFCAGGDIADLGERAEADECVLSFDDRVQRLQHLHRISFLLHRMAKPTIAAINGPAMGAGLSLALACDIRLMSSTATLGAAFADLGASGDFGGSWLAARLIGLGRAKDLYFLNDWLDAESALQVGLVSAVIPADEFDVRVGEVALRLARGPTAAFALMKQNFAETESRDLGSFLDFEARTMSQSMDSEDFRRATESFLTKRPATFQGR
jgi:2-(1,2-epoxy-1,2-dihydrophenyl)acetyl-CoA isomerase